jgi:hypothetical protein
VGNLLKALLQARHLQAYSDFVAEYERCARGLDLSRQAAAPTKAQYYRWLSGQVQNLPRGYHCVVLEAMFPGRTASALFGPAESSAAPVSPASPPAGGDELLAAIAPAVQPAALAGLWVSGYVFQGSRVHVDLSTVTATKDGVTSRNYPPEPRAEGYPSGHTTDISARLVGRHVLGQWRNRNDSYYYGSLHLAVLPGDTILDGYYTGFLNDTQIVAEPWRWVRVQPASAAGVDLTTVTLAEPRRLYDTVVRRTPFDGPIPLEQVLTQVTAHS